MRAHANRIISILTVLGLSTGFATAGTDNATFYQHERDGWHFYDDPPPEKDLTKAPSERPAEKPEPEKAESDPQEPRKAPPGPKPMSVKWIKENVAAFRRRAINNPTRKNVRAYMYLQKAAMDKASRFSEVSSEVTVGDPYLDEKARRPTATYAVNAAQRRASRSSRGTLKALGETDNVGLLFVFSSDCPYCRTQAPVLKRFGELYKLPIRAVSLDGNHMPGKPFPAASYDPSLGERLGVKQTPATFLVKPPNGMSPLANGVLSLKGLKKRAILVAKREGWIDRETYEATTSVNPVDPGTAIKPGTSEQQLDDPDALIRYIRNHSAGEL